MDADAQQHPVVVVDDDPVSRELVVALLHKMNLRNPVLQGRDGEEACALVASSPTTPVLLLLDLNMPRRSGLEVLRWVREESAFPRLPVVMLTATASLEEVEAAYALGIESYLVKPVGIAALQDVLGRIGLPWRLLPPEPEGRP